MTTLANQASWEAVMQAEDPAAPLGRVAPLALRQGDAAAALGLSEDSFARYVAPEIGMIRRGRLRLAPVKELERWLASNAVQVRGGA
jgi:hypothetical protein